MILLTYGTRPEYIKIKPLFDKLRHYKVLYIGQHKDTVNGVCDRYIDIKQGENRLDSIISSILNNDNAFFGIDKVLVQGDTTSALGVALAAFHRGIPVVHLEAGLRTYNNKAPYPEEANRRFIDIISDILFCPTKTDFYNLKNERVNGKLIISGNTGLDNLYGIETGYDNTVFCTMHRRENLADIVEWFKAISKLAEDNQDLKFFMPLHPNKEIRKHEYLLSDNVCVLDCLSHKETINILKNCKFVITDSGGVQEEASFLKKRTFVCREFTERNECVGVSSVLCKTPTDLLSNFGKYKNDYKIDAVCPYGDGSASDIVSEVLNG